MSIRVTLAVLVGVLLLAAVAPAAEDARHARREAALDRAASTVDERATALVAGSAPPRGIPGPRRSVTLSLPDGASLVFTNHSSVLRGHIDGRGSVLLALPVPIHLPSRALRVTHNTRLVLAFEVRGDRPALVVTRGFIREGAAKNGHADTPRTALPSIPVDR